MPLIFHLAPVWIFFLLGWVWFHGLAARGRIIDSFAVAWTLATILLGAACILISEVLGAFNHLERGPCAVSWLGADAVLFGLVWRWGWPHFPTWRIQSWMKGATGVFLLVLGVCALATPTTVWDSHTFHLPRVMHWLQNRSVASYATNIPRQIEYPPGVEMAIAQLMLLAGNDWPANLPQCWALVTAAMLAAFLARQFLAENPLRRGEISPKAVQVAAALAAILVVAAPAAAPQAMSSLCDVAAAMWVMAAIALGWLFLKSPDKYIYGIGSAVALALAFSAKVTTALYAAPFVAVALVRHRRIGAIALAAMLVINGPWMMRNYELVKNPIGSKATFDVSAVRHVTPRGVAGNVLRNLVFYTRTPSQAVTTALNSFFSLGMDVIDESWDDPDWTFGKLGFEFPVKSKVGDGDGLGNCHSLLLVGAAGVLFFVYFKPRSALGIYLLALAVSFILFSGYLRWDPWHDRLQIAYFILAAPFAAGVAGICFPAWLSGGVAVFLLGNAALTVLMNPTYPALAALFQGKPREELYFAVRPELYETTAALADDIVHAGCTNVLLKVDDDTWEYPLWVLLRNRGFSGRINHALVENESSVLPQVSSETPGTVILAMHADRAAIPADFGLAVSYDTWRAFYRTNVPEQRARMMGGHATLKYRFARPGLLLAHFEPRNAAGAPATNGIVEVTVKNIETNTFQTLGALRTNIQLSSLTSFSCPVVAPSVTITITNLTSGNEITTLGKLDVVEQVRN